MDLCRMRTPDLLDLTLPDGNGFSLVEWLRRQSALRNLPLVVYSGQEMSRLLGPMRTGIYDYDEEHEYRF